jgi:hypothetical protein
VKFLKDLERFFERNIEGFLRQKFAAGVHPVEIGKKITRAMEENVQVSVSKTYAPNYYAVALHPDDLARMESLDISLTDELAEYIIKQAAHKGFSIVGDPKVELQADATLTVGDFVIRIKFIAVAAVEKDIGTDHSGTQVFEGVVRLGSLPAKHKAVPCAQIRVVEGVDAGKAWELGISPRMYIGRRETNEIPLGDMNSSRVHAYIELDEGQHVLHDAKSLNGTYVNAQRITRKLLCPGDRVKIGHTILVYEVI